jgi:thiol-disulfide isomerase/thioredoxin
MTYMGFILALTLFLQNPNPSVPAGLTAADVLRTMLKALEKADIVEYEVRRVAQNPADKDTNLHTTILATRSPFQFYAKTRDENGQVVEMAVSDGKTTRTSAAGKAGENPTFTEDGKTMIVSNLANQDLAITRQLLVDPSYLNEALASQRTILLGKGEIENEQCHIIIYARPSSIPNFLSTQYIWVSATTGLPRAVQLMNVVRGHSNLTMRVVISKVRFNPAIPAETFAYQPKASDTVAVLAAKPVEAEPAAVVGKPLPELEVRDVDLKALKLTDFKGKPTLIAFWASWCGPCLKEMPTLQKLVKEYQGKLQVLGIAVQEERGASMQFLKAHPQYKFVFLTEPRPGEQVTPLQTFFGIRSIPVGVFVNAQGKILDRWSGFSDEKEFVKRIRGLMGQ